MEIHRSGGYRHCGWTNLLRDKKISTMQWDVDSDSLTIFSGIGDDPHNESTFKYKISLSINEVAEIISTLANVEEFVNIFSCYDTCKMNKENLKSLSNNLIVFLAAVNGFEAKEY
jgi:hypothetical protein